VRTSRAVRRRVRIPVNLDGDSGASLTPSPAMVIMRLSVATAVASVVLALLRREALF